MTTDKQAKHAARELAAREGIFCTAACRRVTTETAPGPRDRAAMLAGLVARSRDKFTRPTVPADV